MVGPFQEEAPCRTFSLLPVAGIILVTAIVLRVLLEFYYHPVSEIDRFPILKHDRQRISFQVSERGPWQVIPAPQHLDDTPLYVEIHRKEQPPFTPVQVTVITRKGTRYVVQRW